MEKIIHKSSRAFNEVLIDKTYGLVRKSSKDRDKLSAEFNWYSNIPQKFQGLVPRPISLVHRGPFESSTLTMEYCPYSTLSELFTNPRVQVDWEQILLRLLEVHALFSEESVEVDLNMDILLFHVQKSLQRIEQLKNVPELAGVLSAEKIQINNEIYRNIDVEFLMKKLNENSHLITTSVVHGDYCLSNILYDLSSDSVKLIDPRGYLLDKAQSSFYGDPHYDFAKLMHSIEGLYDFIVQGSFNLIEIDNTRFLFSLPSPRRSLVSILDNASRKAGALEYRKVLQVLLFLTMIPLHYDSPKRQLAFYLRAVQLFSALC